MPGDVIVDSDVIIEFLRGNAKIHKGFAGLIDGKARICFCAVSSAEVYAGMRPAEEKKVSAFFSALERLPIDHETGVKAGEYLRTYHKSHHVELGDALIAAAASVNRVALWTLNRKHYPMPDVRHHE